MPTVTGTVTQAAKAVVQGREADKESLKGHLRESDEVQLKRDAVLNKSSQLKALGRDRQNSGLEQLLQEKICELLKAYSLCRGEHLTRR